MKLTYMHVFDIINNKLLFKKLVTHVPRAEEELRIGGEGNEKYYRVVAIVWIYDEPDCPYERVNIGVDEV